MIDQYKLQPNTNNIISMINNNQKKNAAKSEGTPCPWSLAKNSINPQLVNQAKNLEKTKRNIKHPSTTAAPAACCSTFLSHISITTEKYMPSATALCFSIGITMELSWFSIT
ncbi:MAG: hypothetical protein WBM41_03870 [Arenicellales bacterium]